jgi:hypothetical protein
VRRESRRGLGELKVAPSVFREASQEVARKVNRDPGREGGSVITAAVEPVVKIFAKDAALTASKANGRSRKPRAPIARDRFSPTRRISLPAERGAFD